METRDRRDSLQLTAYRLMDTVREVTTITIQLNEQGDTTFRGLVTDRTTVRDRQMSEIRAKREEVTFRMDTVYIERDSLRVATYGLPDVTQKAHKTQILRSGFVSALQWIFLIIVAAAVLIIVMRTKR